MQMIFCYILMAVVPYLLCSLNPAIIITKLKTGEDIRTLGSGNAGLTNTLRTQGKLAALLVLLFDVAKGVFSILLVRLAFFYIGGVDTAVLGNNMNYVAYLAGVFGVIGHTFPLYYKFKGGKGVLVTVSVLYAVDWVSASILLGLFFVIVLISRYVSLGSIIAGSLYPFCVLILSLHRNDPTAIGNFLSALAIAIMLVVMHRENIKRLRNKTEKKLFGNKDDKGNKGDN